MAWYLAVNCDLLPESKEDSIDAYRQALEAEGIETGGWFERQVDLALLGGYLQLGWSKAGDELAWWTGRAVAATRTLWPTPVSRPAEWRRPPGGMSAPMIVGRSVPLGLMTAEQLISFARGAPSLDIVDVAGLKAAAARAFDADPTVVTPYGASTGYPPLRKWIADKHGVEVDQVLVANGSLEVDAFLFEHLVKPGDVVIVEKPTYDRTLLNLKNMGADVRPDHPAGGRARPG